MLIQTAQAFAPPSNDAVADEIREHLRKLAEQFADPVNFGSAAELQNLKQLVGMALLSDVTEADAMDVIRAAADVSDAIRWGREADMDELEGAVDWLAKAANSSNRYLEGAV